MKKLYFLPLLLLTYFPVTLQSQTDVYSQSIVKPNINLRGGIQVLATVSASFLVDGYVVVHFDGECYASVGDLIVLAGTNTGEWSTNDGNVSVETSKAGFGRPFSHTRVYPVSAGQHSYNAVAQNYVETEGSGIATIFGTLTVEYFPETAPSTVNAKGFIFNGDVTNTKTVAEQSIHANGPGKVLVRFDGFITSQPGDRIVLAASNSMNWSFNDGNVSVEALNEGDVDGNSFSHTRVYTVPSAGDYTYYALSQQYGETANNAMVWIYGNLLVEFFPDAGTEKVFSKGFTLPEIDLNGQATEITNIQFNAPEAGKVLVVLDGYSTANKGYNVIVAASNNGDWSANDGSITLQALDDDQNRYSFSHSRVYTVGAGNQTFYAVGEITGGTGTETADLFGQLSVKYIPNSTTAVKDLSLEKNSFEIYPNPSNDVVHISFKNPVDNEEKIQLLDMNGHILREYPNNSKEVINIDLSSFPTNVYWISVGGILKHVIKM